MRHAADQLCVAHCHCPRSANKGTFKQWQCGAAHGDEKVTWPMINTRGVWRSHTTALLNIRYVSVRAARALVVLCIILCFLHPSSMLNSAAVYKAGAGGKLRAPSRPRLHLCSKPALVRVNTCKYRDASPLHHLVLDDTSIAMKYS